MAKRKTLLGALMQAHERRMREQQRQRRLAEQEQKRFEREQAKKDAAEARRREQEEKRRKREIEQAQREKQRSIEQKERERARAAAATKKEEETRKRRAEAEERTRKKEEAERQREAKRQERETLIAEAEARTRQIEDYVRKLDNLLAERRRDLNGRVAPKASEEFNTRGPSGLEESIAKSLAESAYPPGFPEKESVIQYRPESRVLIINCELPPQSVVPDKEGFKYVKTKNEVQPVPRKIQSIKALYGRVLSRAAIRVLAEAFESAPITLVSEIVLNGYVSSVDPATGQTVRPCLLSVQATRELYDGLVLDAEGFDPEACLRRLNAIVSPHPYDLEAVRPVVEFDLSKYKTIEGIDVVAGMDGRMDLLALKPIEFEHLVRSLFEKIGMEAENIQQSRDGGVDAIAYNKDPVLSGLCVIQAKRYKDRVDAESVYALSGTMQDKSATKGILVTTSWFGKDSRDFAHRNGRMELIDGRELKALLEEHLDLDVLIGLPKLPKGWSRRDVGGVEVGSDD